MPESNPIRLFGGWEIGKKLDSYFYLIKILVGWTVWDAQKDADTFHCACILDVLVIMSFGIISLILTFKVDWKKYLDKYLTECQAQIEILYRKDCYSSPSLCIGVDHYALLCMLLGVAVLRNCYPVYSSINKVRVYGCHCPMKYILEPSFEKIGE